MRRKEGVRREGKMEQTPLKWFEEIWEKLKIFDVGKGKIKQYKEVFSAWLALAGLPLGQPCKIQNVASALCSASEMTRTLIHDQEEKTRERTRSRRSASHHSKFTLG